MRAKDIKYFGCGISIGAVIASFFFIFVFFTSQTSAQTNSLISVTAGLIQPSPSVTIPATSTSTISPTPTVVPSATPSPLPTATQSSTDLMITRGELKILGPLPREQQIRLYEASLTFIAPTYEQSKKISELVNQARFSDPSTTCGPLAVAILQSAGILGDIVKPHDFFLLNPDLAKDREILERAFPKELYEDTRYKIKLNKVNWAVQPLVPGDFVYTYMGKEGNFEHMLVVNRVDSQGRAYSVTNYNTEQGFIIDEVMLYDPNDPSAGIFARWTKREKQLLGSTGFAGYEVWRMKE